MTRHPPPTLTAFFFLVLGVPSLIALGLHFWPAVRPLLLTGHPAVVIPLACLLIGLAAWALVAWDDWMDDRAWRKANGESRHV